MIENIFCTYFKYIIINIYYNVRKEVRILEKQKQY